MSRFAGIFAIAVSLVSGQALAADKVTIGIVNAVSDGTLFIARDKGYFQAEGIEADFVEFDTGAKMVAPMGAGQLDVGGGAASAGLYNAFDRGIRIRIVADKATNVKGAPFQSFLVRKELFDSGKVKGLADMKGRKVAITGAGGSDASVLNEAMKSVGLKYSDVEKIYLGFPQHAPALQNGSMAPSRRSRRRRTSCGWARRSCSPATTRFIRTRRRRRSCSLAISPTSARRSRNGS